VQVPSVEAAATAWHVRAICGQACGRAVLASVGTTNRTMCRVQCGSPVRSIRGAEIDPNSAPSHRARTRPDPYHPADPGQPAVKTHDRIFSSSCVSHRTVERHLPRDQNGNAEWHRHRQDDRIRHLRPADSVNDASQSLDYLDQCGHVGNLIEGWGLQLHAPRLHLKRGRKSSAIGNCVRNYTSKAG
jgi:hypothetical protein